MIKNPIFQTPKSITLNTNYNQLLPNLANSKPPKINLSSKDLENWIGEIEKLKKDYQQHDEKYSQWLKSQKLHIAPGLDSIMTPKHKELHERHDKDNKKDTDDIDHDKEHHFKEDHQHTDDINDLDKIFGKARIE